MDLEARLRGFSGTTTYYRHWLGFNYTDGAKEMADLVGAHWLLDLVGSYQPKLRNVPFQIWRVESKDMRGVVTMREDSGLRAKVLQEIPFTDFPEGAFEMYYVDNVLMLKSEY